MKDSVRVVIEEIIKLKDHKVYQAGGSLLPHTTRDYDFLVYCPRDVDAIIKFWSIDYTEFGVSDIACYEAYDACDSGKKLIIKLLVKNMWVDLLYVEDSWLDKSVYDYMKCIFPISAQCIAKNMVTGEMIGEVNVDTITYTCANNSEHLLKYKKYYPNAVFTELNPVPTFDISEDLSIF